MPHGQAAPRFAAAAAGTATDPIPINGTIIIADNRIVNAVPICASLATGRIVVRPGGILKINGGVYTAADNCSAMWQGIRQWSKKIPWGNLPNGWYLTINNDAYIEHALIGVATMPTSLYDLTDMADELQQIPDFGLSNLATTVLSDLFNSTFGDPSGGGSLAVKNATFQNCFIGIANMFDPSLTTNIVADFIADGNLHYPFQSLTRSEAGILAHESHLLADNWHFVEQKYGLRSNVVSKIELKNAAFADCDIGISARDTTIAPFLTS